MLYIRFTINLSAILFILTFSFGQTYPGQQWGTCSPREAGLHPDSLAALDARFKSGTYGFIDSWMIVRNGKIAYQKKYEQNYARVFSEYTAKHPVSNPVDTSGMYNYYNEKFHPYYQKSKLHAQQSSTHSVISMLVGVALQRKEFPDLDTPLLSFLDSNKIQVMDVRKKQITIRHLLTMTCGLSWTENDLYYSPGNSRKEMEATYDWINYIANRPMMHTPGTTFTYNSGTSMLLGYILQKSTGLSPDDYAQRHLFKPLGINSYFWKKTPSGLVDAAAGLYLADEDMARLCYLYMKNGVWENKQIVSREWVKASFEAHIKINDYNDYGYHWWLFTYDGTKQPIEIAAGNGWGNQVPMMIPELDMVVIFSGWNIFPDKPSFDYWQINKQLFHSLLDTDVKIKKIRADSSEIVIKLAGRDSMDELYYTIDGTEPTLKSQKQKGSIKLKKSAVVKTKAFRDRQEISSVSEKTFFLHKGLSAQITLKNPISPKYPGEEGNKTLLNGIGGPVGYANTEWVGFEGADLDATIAFQKPVEVSTVQLHSINQPLSWVHPAERIEVYAKHNNGNFVKVAETKVANSNEKIILSEISFDAVLTNELRIVATHRIIPAGNPGAGYPAWLFIDELVVK